MFESFFWDNFWHVIRSSWLALQDRLAISRANPKRGTLRPAHMASSWPGPTILCNISPMWLGAITNQISMGTSLETAVTLALSLSKFDLFSSMVLFVNAQEDGTDPLLTATFVGLSAVEVEVHFCGQHILALARSISFYLGTNQMPMTIGVRWGSGETPSTVYSPAPERSDGLLHHGGRKGNHGSRY